MKRNLRMRCLLLLLPWLALPLRAEIVDRILAVVGDQVVTWSDVVAEAHYQAFLSGLPPPDASELNRKENWQAVLSRLVDQALLAQAREMFPFAPSEDGQARLQEVRKQFSDPAGYRSALARSSFSEAALISRLDREANLLAFVDYRLRPQVQLNAQEIEQYYQETLLPELRRQGQENVPPLEEVRGQIVQILIEAKVNELLDHWLQDLRRRTPVKTLE